MNHGFSFEQQIKSISLASKNFAKRRAVMYREYAHFFSGGWGAAHPDLGGILIPAREPYIRFCIINTFDKVG